MRADLPAAGRPAGCLRVTRRKIELRKEPLDLCSVIADAVDAVRPQVDAARQTLVIKMAGTPIAVDGDPVRLQQILVNLLSNASKYSQAEDSIELCPETDRTDAVIGVRTTASASPPKCSTPSLSPSFSSSRPSTGPRAAWAWAWPSSTAWCGPPRRERSAQQAPARAKGASFSVRLPLSKRKPKNRRKRTVTRTDGPLDILIIEDNAECIRC